MYRTLHNALLVSTATSCHSSRLIQEVLEQRFVYLKAHVWPCIIYAVCSFALLMTHCADLIMSFLCTRRRMFDVLLCQYLSLNRWNICSYIGCYINGLLLLFIDWVKEQKLLITCIWHNWWYFEEEWTSWCPVYHTVLYKFTYFNGIISNHIK